MLYLGADHNGFQLKQQLKTFLNKKKVKYEDCGAFQYNKTDDYPDFAFAVGKKVGPQDLGVLFCGSGHGMVIAANKLKGVRAIMPLNADSARDGRRDDHANVLVMAAWECNMTTTKKILQAFLSTKPGKHPRYLRRLDKIKKIER